jgi:hypothetical protein
MKLVKIIFLKTQLGGREVGQTMYTHVSKGKNDKIIIIKTTTRARDTAL